MKSYVNSEALSLPQTKTEKKSKRKLPVDGIKKRTRRHLSCEPCRSRKTKCDRLLNCTACVLHEVTCHYFEAEPISPSENELKNAQLEIIRLNLLVQYLTQQLSSQSQSQAYSPYDQNQLLLLPSSPPDNYSYSSNHSQVSTRIPLNYSIPKFAPLNSTQPSSITSETPPALELGAGSQAFNFELLPTTTTTSNSQQFVYPTLEMKNPFELNEALPLPLPLLQPQIDFDTQRQVYCDNFFNHPSSTASNQDFYHFLDEQEFKLF